MAEAETNFKTPTSPILNPVGYKIIEHQNTRIFAFENEPIPVTKRGVFQY